MTASGAFKINQSKGDYGALGSHFVSNNDSFNASWSNSIYVDNGRVYSRALLLNYTVKV